jgi:hypothetical protein
MKRAVRSIGVALLAILAAVLLALTSSTKTVYTLTAATYALPGLFGYPFGTDATVALATPYITAITGPSDRPLLVVSLPLMPPPDTIETGSVVFGISQGAQDASTYKSDFNRYWANNAGDPPDIKFVVLGNPDRPNGGSASRLDAASATPTQTAGADGITTYDITRQYDSIADAPTNPTNFLAIANQSMGFLFGHIAYASVDMSQAILQDTRGDTNYYLIPTYPLPLLIPLDVIPGIGHIIADSMDPTLRVLVEAAYDRTISPGEPTPSNPNYFPDATTLADNLRLASSVGMDNWSENLGQGRPLGTERPGPYGVGGPPVALNPPQNSPNPLQNPQDPPQDPQVEATLTARSQPGSVPTHPAIDNEGSGAGITEPSNVTAANTPAVKQSMTGANAEGPQVTNRGPIWSKAPTRRPVRDDGSVNRMLDSLTTGLKPRTSEPGEPDSAASDDDNSSHQPSSES